VYKRQVAHHAALALPAGHILRPFAFIVAGWMSTLAGDLADGVHTVEDALRHADALQLPGPAINALCVLALARLLNDDWEPAQSSADAAYRLWDAHDLRDGTAATALMASVNGLIAARVGQPERARQFLALAGARSPMVSPQLPWMAAIHESLRAWTEVLLGSPRAATVALGRASGSLAHSPPSPFLAALIQRCTDAVRTTSPLAQLSPAEREIFRHLDSQLTLSEIGAQLHVSHATVKTQVASIYRKLGVNSRREAVAFGDPPSPRPGYGSLEHP
jgi:LuxR family maltose regulon positive regulatory protein